MRPTLKNSTRLLAGAAVAFAATFAAQAQQAGQQAPDGWYKTCTKQQDSDVCVVQNVRRASNGQVVTAVNLVQYTGKENRAIFQVAVPTNRAIPPGIGIQIDDGQARKMQYQVCFQDRCIAEAPLTDEIVAQMKRGAEMKVASVNFQNQPNPIAISLSGFTDAFEGDPLKASEVESRQRELQQAVEQEKGDFYQRALEKQKAAKEGNGGN